MKTVRQKILGVLAPVFVFALLFGFWQWICVANEIPKWLLPSPANIFVCMVENVSEFGTHFLISFITVLSGFLLAVPLGVLLATGITSSKTLSAALSPYIIVLVTTPLIIILPLLMLFLGYGIKVRIIGVVLQSFAIVNMNTCTGILNVPTIRHELMQTVGASKWAVAAPCGLSHRRAGYLHRHSPQRHLRHHRLCRRRIRGRQRGVGRADHQVFAVSENHRILRLHLLRHHYRPDHVWPGFLPAKQSDLLEELNPGRRMPSERYKEVCTMKKILALVMALALVLLAAPGLAEMKEFTYCVPRTVENLEDSPFHIAQRLLAEEGYTMNIQETFGTTDTKMVATNQAQFCGPGPFYVLVRRGGGPAHQGDYRL